MLFAVIREAAEAASISEGPLRGYPPWLIVLAGSVIAAALIWVFVKLLKVALWITLLVVLGGGLLLAGRMFLGQ